MDDRRRQFETLALPHLDAALSLARWLARSQADAEDIVQEAMLRAFRAFDSASVGQMRPWLMRIVRNCFHDHRAKAARLAPDEGLGRRADEAPTPEASAELSSDRRRLERLLALLPDDFREALVLREFEDMSYREIAEAVGVPIGTVMSRLARARALLKDHWMQEEAR